MEKEVIGEKIVVYKNLIDGEQIIKDAYALSSKFQLKWTTGVINEGVVDRNVKSCSIINLHDNAADSRDLYREKNKITRVLDEAFGPAMMDYAKTYGFRVKQKEGWEFMRYEETEKFDFHTDQSEFHPCEISMVVYPNSDYEGGQMQFFNYMDGYPWKPVANSIIFFPSTADYRHRVLPVTSGTRYSIINFAF